MTIPKPKTKPRPKPKLKDAASQRSQDAVRQEARAERAEAKLLIRDKRIAYLEEQLKKVRKAARE